MWYGRELKEDADLQKKVGKLQDAVIASCFLSTFNSPLPGCGDDRRAGSVSTLRRIITGYIRNIRYTKPSGKVTPQEETRLETAEQTHRRLLDSIGAVDRYIGSTLRAANAWNLHGMIGYAVCLDLFVYIKFNVN